MLGPNWPQTKTTSYWTSPFLFHIMINSIWYIYILSFPTTRTYFENNIIVKYAIWVSGTPNPVNVTRAWGLRESAEQTELWGCSSQNKLGYPTYSQQEHQEKSRCLLWPANVIKSPTRAHQPNSPYRIAREGNLWPETNANRSFICPWDGSADSSGWFTQKHIW